MATFSSRLLTGSLCLSAVAFMACRDTAVEPSSQRPVFAARVSTLSSYAVTDLGTLGGAYSAAYAINSAGQVVGSSQTADGQIHAFLWQRGVMQDLGTLGGASSVAQGINAQGQVVGWSQRADGLTHAFLWQRGVMTDLGTLGGDLGPFQVEASRAYGINAQGQVVGGSTPGSRAFLWQDGTMTPLGTFKFSAGLAINARGQIAGYSEQFTDFLRATLWQNGVATNLGLLVDIPQRFTPQSAALAINERGQIAGFSDIVGYGGPQHAFLWQGGVMTDLGTLGGDTTRAYGINRQGHVVGYAWTPDGQAHAFLWRDGVMTDLASVTRLPDYAAAVGPQGETVGSSQEVNDASMLRDLGLLPISPTDTATINELVKTFRNSKMAHCCHRHIFPSRVAGMTNVGVLGDVPSYATDINERDQVVGYYYAAGSDASHAVLWTPR